MTSPVVTLEYAVPQTLGGARARSAFGLMLALAILSGFCVGASFLVLTDNIAVTVLHVAVFGVTLTVAVRAGMALMRLATQSSDAASMPRMVLDGLAGLGLLIIGLAPPVYYAIEASGNDTLNKIGAMALGFAYALLGGTTFRHVMLYRMLASMCRQINRTGLARMLTALGWVKTIYEGIWLSAMAVGFFVLTGPAQFYSNGNTLQDFGLWCLVIGAFGAMGFTAIWIWMIVAHTLLFRLARVN